MADAERLLTTAPPPEDARVELSRDFRLWLYRDRLHLTWAALEEQPPWRTERDLAYIALEGLAGWWHAEQERARLAKQQQEHHFTDFKARARQQLGLVK